jgi:aconitase (EC 4.2.1.3)
MAPEYGATVGFFPLTEDTLDYLYKTGRDEEHIELIREYGKKIGLFYDGRDKEYDRYLEFDLSSVEPSIAGPANPEDRIPLNENKILNNLINETIIKERGSNERKSKILRINGNLDELKDGSVVIAAITSCTNTSNPDVLVGAALLAKNAVERGLRTKYYVKTSFAPGSPVVSEYLRRSGLMPYLEALGFHIVGFGCTTCIGNAGPLIPEVEQAIKSEKIYTAAVLSGNRNFEGRINPYVKGAFLASPLLVVAYAISGRIDIDFYNEPLGYDPNGNPVYLRDIWPEKKEIRKYEDMFISRDLYIERKKRIFEGVKEWKDLEIPKGNVYEFDKRSTYILEPPWFENIKKIGNVKDARILAIFGDRITTDHISPAGNIVTDLEKYRKIWDEFKKIGPKALETVEIPAAKYLMERGVPPDEFNTYGARRGNHEIMVRGGFANVKIRNLIVDKQGGYTIHYPDGKLMTIFDASMEYQKECRELVVVAGKCMVLVVAGLGCQGSLSTWGQGHHS